MPDTVWIIIILALMLLGFIGSVLPVMPGTLFAFIGLLVYKLCPLGEELSWGWIVFGVFLMLFSVITEYWIPIVTTRKFGGSRLGVIGVTIGMIIGLFFSPFGVIYCPFLGALIGEIINDTTNHKKAIKASIGSFLGFLFSIGINIVVCGVLMAIVILHRFFS